MVIMTELKRASCSTMGDQQLCEYQSLEASEHPKKLMHQNSEINVNRIQELCFDRLMHVLNNWQDIEVRTVPGVMYQVRCGHDEFDPSIDYQINWFLDCTETLIHSHRHSFDTYCLEGEYIEKLWEVVDNGDGDVTYQFRRNADTTFDLHQIVPGTLCHTKTRHHFPGNRLHVDTRLFHSVTPMAGSSGRVLTFLVKRIHLTGSAMFSLTKSPTIEALDDAIQPANDDERQVIYEKLQQVLTTSFR